MLRSAHVKRFFDTAIAVMLLIALFPLLVVLAATIAVVLGRPVFFRQLRPGLRGHPFTLVKFRTMRDAVDASGVPLSDAVRLTRLGAWLRAASLDELPELWNVVRGDMALVGPRPLLMEYLPRYSREQMRRHEMRPGITGWAQVHGRNTLAWEARFSHDVWYVDHWSLALDIRILSATAARVIARDGITQAGHATAAPFTGSIDRDIAPTGRAACSHS